MWVAKQVVNAEEASKRRENKEKRKRIMNIYQQNCANLLFDSSSGIPVRQHKWRPDEVEGRKANNVIYFHGTHTRAPL
jgi:hypothetical protein